MKDLKNILSKKLFAALVLLSVAALAFTVFVISDNITKNKIEVLKNEKYNIYSQKLKDNIEILIKNKQESTLSIALALSQNPDIKSALNNKDTGYLHLKRFSKILAKNTSLKNTWFHVIDKNGVSIYRSWIDKRGDSLRKIRLDVVKMIEKPQLISTISTGKFDMTFKSMVPIYDKKEFIGIFEIISHFNSIADQLHHQGISSVILVDKSYKEQLTKPLTKLFIGDYYVANGNVSKELTDYVKKNSVQEFFKNEKPYILDENFGKLITTYSIPDIKGNPMGLIIAFRDLSSISMNDVKILKSNTIFYTVIPILLFGLLGYYFITKKHAKQLDCKVKERTKELNSEKLYIQTILDTNPSIILVTRNSTLLSANKSFFKFFESESIDDFKENYNCICDLFLKIDDNDFPRDKTIAGKNWAEYLANYSSEDHLVELKYKEKIYFFTINGLYLNFKDEILVTMQNITELKNKEKLLFEQSKLASMGEMIGNIAHQWRQPLSVISSGATGIKIQREYKQLDDQELYRICNMINDNAQYLSKTIDDFKNFIKGDREKSSFHISTEIEKLKTLMDSSIRTYNLQLCVNIKDDILVHGYENELLQCFINIFNNAKDVLKNNDPEQRFIDIDISNDDKNLHVKFTDNGGGMSKSIQSKIFEPYFTTKHKSKGTGLGLHMTYNIIVNGMGGNIEVENIKTVKNNKTYTGAQFTVTLPINNRS